MSKCDRLYLHIFLALTLVLPLNLSSNYRHTHTNQNPLMAQMSSRNCRKWLCFINQSLNSNSHQRASQASGRAHRFRLWSLHSAVVLLARHSCAVNIITSVAFSRIKGMCLFSPSPSFTVCVWWPRHFYGRVGHLAAIIVVEIWAIIGSVNLRYQSRSQGRVKSQHGNGHNSQITVHCQIRRV